MSEWTLIFYQKKRGGGRTEDGIIMTPSLHMSIVGVLYDE